MITLAKFVEDNNGAPVDWEEMAGAIVGALGFSEEEEAVDLCSVAQEYLNGIERLEAAMSRVGLGLG